MTTPAAEPRVVAVVVTYQPDLDALAGARALRPQVGRVLIMDNGSDASRLAHLCTIADDATELIALPRNLGVGAAHNAGIQRAREAGATHVLLMDQDSVPGADMVARLLAAERRLLARGDKVGALGPVYHDPRIGRSWPFFRMSRFGVHGQPCAGVGEVRCDFLISSGTLIRMPVLDEVGPINESYFLEHVDTEWSLRARAAGYSLFGICDAHMDHHLGDDNVALPVSRRRVQLYRPYRHYYLYRNALLLAREPYAPTAWKLNEARRLLYRFGFFGFFVAPRLQRLKYMMLGLWHGLAGRTGPLNS
jgi:rhamnosyltransferase